MMAAYRELENREVETIGLVPAEGPVGTGKTPADGAGGVEPDHVEADRGLADFFQYPSRVRQRMALHVLALPGVVVEQQVRVRR